MKHGNAVTLVCPGGVDTPLTDAVETAGVDQLHATCDLDDELWGDGSTPNWAAPG